MPFDIPDSHDILKPIDESALDENAVTLVLLLVDDSASMQGGELTLINACNASIEALIEADNFNGKPRRKYWVGLMSFHGFIHRPFAPVNIEQCIGVDEYRAAADRTPLYRRTQEGLTFLKSEYERLKRTGIKCRTALVVVTDGEDNVDRKRGTNMVDHEGNILPVGNLTALAQEMSNSPDHMLFGIGINTDRANSWDQMADKKPSFLGGLMRKIGLLSEMPRHSSASDIQSYPTGYHAMFMGAMGFTGINAQVLTAERSGESLNRALLQASQSIARPGATARTKKSAF